MSARSIGAVRWMETLATGLARDDTLAERLILEITDGVKVGDRFINPR